VFKLFVANPKKSVEVSSILAANRAKLIAYLETFHVENTDPQFVDEKRLLIE
jgi:calcium binding protein 39